MLKCSLCGREIKSRHELSVAMAFGLFPVLRPYHKKCQDEINVMAILISKKNKDRLGEGIIFGSGYEKLRANSNSILVGALVMGVASLYMIWRFIPYWSNPTIAPLMGQIGFIPYSLPAALLAVMLDLLIARTVSYFKYEAKLPEWPLIPGKP